MIDNVRWISRRMVYMAHLLVSLTFESSGGYSGIVFSFSVPASEDKSPGTSANVAGLFLREQRMWMVGDASATHRLHPAPAEEAPVDDLSYPKVCLRIHPADARKTLVQSEVQPTTQPAQHPKPFGPDIKRRNLSRATSCIVSFTPYAGALTSGVQASLETYGE